MRKIMVLATPGEGEMAGKIALELKKLDYEVLCPGKTDSNELKNIQQVDLFVLVGRDTGKLNGLAHTLIRDDQLSVTPRLVVTEEKALADLDYCRFADDILLFPLRPMELAARLRILSWRTEKVDSSNAVKAGPLTLNLSTYEVTVNSRLVDLTFKEYELLRYLMTHQRRVHTRNRLLSRVWGDDYYGGARTVDVHIRRIRSKIETRGQVFIQTVRGVGYRFIG